MTLTGLVGLLFLACVAPPEEDGSIVPNTPSRTAEIEAARRQKAQNLQSEEPNRIERALDLVKDRRVVERVTSGIGGLRVRMGGLVTGSGFAMGPEYVRRDLLRENATFRASARGSYRKYYLMDMELSMPKLAGNHLFIDLYAAHRNYPNIDYYGPGPKSVKTGRTGYELEDTGFEVRTGVRPASHLRLGVLGRYVLMNISYNRDRRFASTDRVFSEATTPGISRQADYTQAGPFVQFDYRDNPGGPRSGGNYLVQFASISDRMLHRFAFSRVDAEAQQYIPFFNQRRVIALRARGSFTEPHQGQVVPFYLQPALGGSDDLRGFRPFRFYDNNLVVANAEYRWEVFSGMDMALFMDAGKVFPKWGQPHLGQLEKSYGFGLRFNVRNDVFLRIDTGFSREGFQVWFKFNNVF